MNREEKDASIRMFENDIRADRGQLIRLQNAGNRKAAEAKEKEIRESKEAIRRLRK